MRIGIDARLWNETGVGRYIRNLVWELSKIDKKNEYVLFLRRNDFLNVKLPGSNFRKKLADVRWHTFSEQISLSPIIEKEKLDLIHFPYYSMPVLYRGKFVVTIHDLIPLHETTGQASTLPLFLYKLKLQAFKFIVGRAAKNSCKIITPSIASKKDIQSLLKASENKIKVVYEGTDEALKADGVRLLDRRGRDEKLRNNSGNKSNMILYVGNAFPHKNLFTLLKAFKLAKNKFSDLSLVLVGKEDYFYRRLKQNAKDMNLESGVTFYGWASDSDLSSLYKKSKLVVIPSFIEGFGLPALEGMANKALVLASDIPALHEVGGETAIYFDPRNEKELSKKIGEVFSGKYDERINEGNERIKDFNWRKTAQETLAIYESCIGI